MASRCHCRISSCSGTPAAPLDKIESAMNAGQDFIDDELCDHYAFRQGKVDWQIWIATGSKPLPRKVVITNRADEARPQSVSLIDWNLKPGLQGLGVQVHAAEGRDQDRDRSAEDQVEERHHDEIIRQIRCGRLSPAVVLASFAMAPYADAAVAVGVAVEEGGGGGGARAAGGGGGRGWWCGHAGGGGGGSARGGGARGPAAATGKMQRPTTAGRIPYQQCPEHQRQQRQQRQRRPECQRQRRQLAVAAAAGTTIITRSLRRQPSRAAVAVTSAVVGSMVSTRAGRVRARQLRRHGLSAVRKHLVSAPGIAIRRGRRTVLTLRPEGIALRAVPCTRRTAVLLAVAQRVRGFGNCEPEEHEDRKQGEQPPVESSNASQIDAVREATKD